MSGTRPERERATGSAVDSPEEVKLLRRIAWRLVPLLTATYLVAYIDRANVSYAKLTMVSSLHMTETEFGFAASLFFVGYLVFEIPSSLALNRYGARLWIARIMFSWGIATILTAWVQSSTWFLVLRFLLGACEAGLYPGMMLYLAIWFPQKQRTGIIGMLTLGSSLGNMLGSGIGGYSLELDGLLGLQGWQWVFLTTGTPALVLTALTLAVLPDSPKTATFLTEGERAALIEAMRRDPPPPKPSGGAPWTAASVSTVVLLGIGAGTVSVALYGLGYWLPTLVKGFGVSSSTNGLLNMIPWGLTSLLLLWLPRRLTTFRAVLITAFTAAVAGLALFLLSISPVSNLIRFSALTLGGTAVYMMVPCFWAMPARLLPEAFLKGAGGATALATIVSLSSLGGFVGQNLMPWVAKATSSVTLPMIVPAGSLLALGLGVIVVYVVVGTGRSPPIGPA